jgi:hypothetical protein
MGAGSETRRGRIVSPRLSEWRAMTLDLLKGGNSRGEKSLTARVMDRSSARGPTAAPVGRLQLRRPRRSTTAAAALRSFCAQSSPRLLGWKS